MLLSSRFPVARRSPANGTISGGRSVGCSYESAGALTPTTHSTPGVAATRNPPVDSSWSPDRARLRPITGPPRLVRRGRGQIGRKSTQRSTHVAIHAGADRPDVLCPDRARLRPITGPPRRVPGGRGQIGRKSTRIRASRRFLAVQIVRTSCVRSGLARRTWTTSRRQPFPWPSRL